MEKVWDGLDGWIAERAEEPGCEKCGHNPDKFPDWEEQIEKIQALVNAQIREIMGH